VSSSSSPTTLLDFEARRRAESVPGRGKTTRSVSARTVYLDLREVRLVLDLACQLGHIPAVPFVQERRRGRRRHTSRVRSHDTPVPEQFRALLGAAHPSLRHFLLLTGRCGLREGEACSREWSDLAVGEDGKAWLTIGPKPSIDWDPKTAASLRTIPLPPEVATDLVAGRPDPAEGWMFASSRGDRRKAFAADLTRLSRKVLGPDGPIFRAHAFRRYFAIECARAGLPMAVTMKYGGWERIDTLVEIYQQASAADLERVAFGPPMRKEGEPEKE